MEFCDAHLWHQRLHLMLHVKGVSGKKQVHKSSSITAPVFFCAAKWRGVNCLVFFAWGLVRETMHECITSNVACWETRTRVISRFPPKTAYDVKINQPIDVLPHEVHYFGPNHQLRIRRTLKSESTLFRIHIRSVLNQNVKNGLVPFTTCYLLILKKEEKGVNTFV